MIPCEHSSGRRQRLGKLSKQGNSCCAFSGEKRRCKRCAAIPNCGASTAASWSKKEWEKHASQQLASWVRLWIMLRDQIDYTEFCRRGHFRQQCGAVRAGMPEGNIGRN
jgi:hypothetical protein